MVRRRELWWELGLCLTWMVLFLVQTLVVQDQAGQDQAADGRATAAQAAGVWVKEAALRVLCPAEPPEHLWWVTDPAGGPYVGRTMPHPDELERECQTPYPPGHWSCCRRTRAGELQKRGYKRAAHACRPGAHADRGPRRGCAGIDCTRAGTFESAWIPARTRDQRGVLA